MAVNLRVSLLILLVPTPISIAGQPESPGTQSTAQELFQREASIGHLFRGKLIGVHFDRLGWQSNSHDEPAAPDFRHVKLFFAQMTPDQTDDSLPSWYVLAGDQLTIRTTDRIDVNALTPENYRATIDDLLPANTKLGDDLLVKASPLDPQTLMRLKTVVYHVELAPWSPEAETEFLHRHQALFEAKRQLDRRREAQRKPNQLRREIRWLEDDYDRLAASIHLSTDGEMLRRYLLHLQSQVDTLTARARQLDGMSAEIDGLASLRRDIQQLITSALGDDKSATIERANRTNEQ